MDTSMMIGLLLNRFKSYFTEERSLTTLLVLLIINLLLIIPATYVPHWVIFIHRLLLTFLLMTGILCVLQHSVLRTLFTVFMLTTIMVLWFASAINEPWLASFQAFLKLLSLLSLLIVVLVQVNREGPVTAHRVRGAIALYLLVGLLFAYGYALIETLYPGSFQFPQWLSKQAPDWNESMLYFSIVTLTTVGFGDFTAIHPIARSLVMAEALIGQLFPAILIARLVTLELETRRSSAGN
jgi:hypothetical protein